MKRIVIIGAGPGGYEAAVRAAQLGADVKLIEKNELGGTCVNVGCIPTKALWEVARIRDDITRGADMGIHVKDLSLDPVGIYNRKNYVVNRMKGGIKFLMKSYPNIEVIKGIGKLKNKNTVTVTTEDEETRDVEADAIIIATGSEVTMPEIEGINLDGVMTSNDILELQEIPDSMVVIGSGVIGMEFTSIYSKFGTKIELIGRVMAKQADGEISRKLESLVDVLNVKFRKGYRAEKIEEKGDKLYVTIYNKEKDDRIIVEGEKVLVASGRKAYMDKLNADEIGIKSDKTGIFVDKDFKTNIDGIYAIGDVVSGNLQLAHLASAQG
ncbi:MAG TPA: NAD(P)/FAD-dependent oxidoreductase, partial [Tissierellaceae bacterium]|nr:NAD(P)/FAD-dependent oxidoreductase [Tissierellaceae bacterium]